MKRKLYISLAFLTSLGATAQQHNHEKCLTDHVYQQQVKEDPSVLERKALFDQQVKQAIASGAFIGKKAQKQIIPVVFHVFHNNGPENISKAQIVDQIRVLNEDFNNVNFTNLRPEFHGVAATMEIEFRLATLDPQGNCTDGITRHFVPETENGTDNIKKVSVWPTDKYFNIWVVESINSTSQASGTILGYAYLPWSGPGFGVDGIIVRHDNIGTIGTAANPNVGVPQYGRTVVHEGGHWLGLSHPFQDSCFGGDDVDDTPPVIAANFGCFYRNSCTNDIPDLPDMIENYMDYANGDCMATFTIGQKIRIKTAMQNWRSKLTSPSNLVATGVADPYPVAGGVCGPQAGFYSTNPTTCQSGKITYKNDSYNYSGAITTVDFNWIFEGGTPSTYSGPAPTPITYNDPGTYDVTLIVSKTIAGNLISDTVILTDYAKVYATDGMYGAGYTQDFEWAFAPDAEWKTYTTSANKWARVATGVGSIEGSYALKVANFPSESGATYTIESPSFNITDVGGTPVVSFYYAFEQRAQGANGTNDQLIVYMSTDCGQTWSPKYNTAGKNLSTNGAGIPVTQLPFIPADKSQWKRVEVSLGNISATLKKNVRYKIEFRSAGGNNFFIDAINMGYPTGIESELYLSDDKFNIYPNPATASANVKLDLVSGSDIKIEVLDLLGRQITTLADGNMEQGMHEFKFDAAAVNAKNGVYMVRLTVNGNSVTKKLLIYNN